MTKVAEKHMRGFARLSPAARKKIASSGGKAAHKAGVAHQWTSETASEAGRKGGSAVHRMRGQKEPVRP